MEILYSTALRLGEWTMHTILQAQQRQPHAPLQSWGRLSRLATCLLGCGSNIYGSIASANQLGQVQLNPEGIPKKAGWGKAMNKERQEKVLSLKNEAKKKNINSNEGLRMKDCAPEGKQDTIGARCVGFASVPPPILRGRMRQRCAWRGTNRDVGEAYRIVCNAMQQP